MVQDPTPPFTDERLRALRQIPFAEVPSPAFVLHLDRLEENCRLLAEVGRKSGAAILLALKGFACHAAFPRIARHLHGTTSSGVHEALLAREHFGGEIHVYAPAFRARDFSTLRRIAHTITVNSPAQLDLALREMPGTDRPQLGLRINPECSEGATELYDPCAPGSRLGTTRTEWDRHLHEATGGNFDAVSGLHWHTLCEQDADALEASASAAEERFGDLFPRMRWLNFGGGHHITRPDYDHGRLVRVIREITQRYGVNAYLEPGEAVALHTGVFVTEVLDIVRCGGIATAILDCSATCHMPDVLEMPYRPQLLDAGAPGEKPHTFRLGGLSCLAGDVIGDYSFETPLRPGQRLVFLDMAHYTMVKTSTFNGVPLPAICCYDRTDGLRVVRRFGYEDYRTRLG